MLSHFLLFCFQVFLLLQFFRLASMGVCWVLSFCQCDTVDLSLRWGWVYSSFIDAVTVTVMVTVYTCDFRQM